MSEILPCPCCGTAPKISVDPDSDTTTISCPHCGLRNWSYKSRRVIGEWNKRLDVESLTRENEMLRKALFGMVTQFGFGVVHDSQLVHDERMAIHAAMDALAGRQA